jgi:hypothetical protein
MVCKKPFHRGLVVFGCGQCQPCRIKKRREWTHRIVLESMIHKTNNFLTLTYNDKSLPEGGTLVKEDYQKFLKKLRRHAQFRYFIVGEYGDKSERPHYHAAIFGLGPEHKKLYDRCWDKGYTYSGELNYTTATYIAGYVTKKLTNANDERTKDWLQGREPEFSRQSLKPGIGALVIDAIVDMLTSENGYLAMEHGDVPLTLKHGGKEWPLGRYLRKKIRLAYGFKDGKAPEIWQKKAKEQALQMLNEKGLLKKLSPAFTISDALVELNLGKIRSIEAKQKLFATRRKI